MRSTPKGVLTLEETLQLKWALGAAMALLCTWAVFFFELGGLWLLPFVTLAIVATGLRPAWAERIPAWVWKLAFPALLVFVAADWFAHRDVLAVLIRLNVLLITIRAAGPRRRREDLQLVMLCLFLLVVAGVLTVSVGFAVVILAFTALALVFLLLVTLSAAELGSAAAPAPWSAVDWGRLLRRLRETFDARFAGIATGLFVLVVAITAGLFTALPRFQIENAVGFLNLQTKRSFTGFSDTVSIGAVTDLAEDTTTAVRLEVSDPARANTQLYWRMVALDAYEGGTFRVSRSVGRVDLNAGMRSREIQGDNRGRAADLAPAWTVYLEPGVSRYLPLAGPFARVTIQERQPLLENAWARTLALRGEPQKLFAYRVEGMTSPPRVRDPKIAELFAAQTRNAARLAGARASFPQTLLDLPPGAVNRGPLEAKVREITGGVTLSAEEFAQAAMKHLAQQHRYSMRSTLPDGPADPFVRWLDSETPGHCEYFAGSFALLARQAGFPTRLVTGFRGGVWNEFENYLMLRNSDAHAWCELYDAASGEWLRVDPTPTAGGVAGAAAALSGAGRRSDRSWSARLDSLRLLWYRRVVNFDQMAQVETVESLRQFGRDSVTTLATTVERWRTEVQEWVKRPWSFQRWIASLTALGALAAVAWLVRRWRTLWRWRRAERRGRTDPIRDEAGRWLRRFARLPAETSPSAVVTELRRLRFGPPNAARHAASVFTAARREWREARRARVGR